jgi:Saxitoxin biosynthesis operon protein SxtJ
MKPSFHEDFSRADEVKSGSDRGFGLTVGGILLLIALVRAYFYGLGWVQYGLGGIAVALLALGLIAPGSLRGLNRAWMKLGLILFKVVNPIVLALIYATTMVPIGLVMRATGHDPLRLRLDPEADSYWIPRDPPGPAPETMINQF